MVFWPAELVWCSSGAQLGMGGGGSGRTLLPAKACCCWLQATCSQPPPLSCCPAPSSDPPCWRALCTCRKLCSCGSAGARSTRSMRSRTRSTRRSGTACSPSSPPAAACCPTPPLCLPPPLMWRTCKWTTTELVLRVELRWGCSGLPCLWGSVAGALRLSSFPAATAGRPAVCRLSLCNFIFPHFLA